MKIKIQNFEWKKTVNNKDFISINDGVRRFSYFLPEGQDRNNNTINYLIKLNNEIDIEVRESKGFTNITKFISQNSESNNQVNKPNIGVDTSKIEKVSQNIEREVNSNNDPLPIITRVMNIATKLKDRCGDAGEGALSQVGLELSAINIQIGKIYSNLYGQAKKKELEYKLSFNMAVNEQKEKDSKITITKANQNAEAQLYDIKVDLEVLNNEVMSYDIIRNGINTLLFAIKDRIKFLRNN